MLLVWWLPFVSPSSRHTPAILSDVVVLVLVVLVPLHVVPIDERFDSLFQVGRLDGERQLLVQLADEQIVAERFPHLHDAHDRGVDLVLPVLVHALLRGLLLLRRLLHLDLIDLYSKELIRKLIVKLELVVILDFAPLRNLGDDAGLAAG